MADTLSYQSIRSANQAREADEARTETRKKNLLILMLQYLSNEGYVESAQSLGKETNIDLSKYEVADNVDLETVLMEYESYYFIKFSKYPKIVKRLNQSADQERAGRFAKSGGKLKRELSTGSTPSLPRLPGPKSTTPLSASRPKSGKEKTTLESKNLGKRNANISNGNTTPSADESFVLKGLVVHGSSSNPDMTNGVPNGQANHNNTDPPRKGFGQIIDIRGMINDATRLNVEEGHDASDRLLKPLGGYMGYSGEWRELAQVISKEIFSENPNVRWEDIIGLDNAKRLVKEAVVYPIKYPQLFKGILSPWKGLLLYGPPGTGKTLLAKAVATECGTTFFNISASSIVSKWRGDSEKLIRVLFELARFHAPSTIFLDELESLMSQRGSQGGSSEHEGSRRMKTELLIQMDGLAKTDDLVFLLAASNLPWELDHAMLRRLEKRILVDLPNLEARKAMFMHYLPAVVSTAESNGLELRSVLDYDVLANKTDGYSGSDLRLVAKESAMRPVRKIFDALENHTGSEELQIALDTITTMDVEAALRNTKPSALTLKSKYLEWQKNYESV